MGHLQFNARVSITLLMMALVVFSVRGTAGAEDAGVRVRFGLKDKAPETWQGRIWVKPGELSSLTGWRPTIVDYVLPGPGKWKMGTRAPVSLMRSNHPERIDDKTSRFRKAVQENGVLASFRDVHPRSTVSFRLRGKAYRFRLSDLAWGETLDLDNGAIRVDRTASSQPLQVSSDDEDFPAAAITSAGDVHLSWTSFTTGLPRSPRVIRLAEAPANFDWLSTPAGGDRLWLRSKVDGKWQPPVAITDTGRDIFRSTVAVDGSGRVWVIWSESEGGNFEIYARAIENGQLQARQRLSNHAGSDLSPVAVTDGSGRVWVAWQSARKGLLRIMVTRQDDSGLWMPAMQVSGDQGNSWAPAITASRVTASDEGRVAIVWDNYGAGDYDVRGREYSLAGAAGEIFPVTASPDYEARPTATYDHQGHLWIAFEESGASWGKDVAAFDNKEKNTPLYSDRKIGVAIRAPDGTWRETVGDLRGALPGGNPGFSHRATRLPSLEPDGETPAEARRAESRKSIAFDNLSRLATDRSGRIWLLVRSRENSFNSRGSLWLEWAAFYDGARWVGPILIPNSDNLMYNQPAVVAPPGGGIELFYSTDHRQRPWQRRPAKMPPGVLRAVEIRDSNDIWQARLNMPAEPVSLELRPVDRSLPAPRALARGAARERSDIARARAHRIQWKGKNWQLKRGEFHRHTEISGDGGSDGPLEDMWRYGIDAANLDFLGNGDHDFGKSEYWWWLIQKTTDAYVIEPDFTTLYTYERSQPYPMGHRNIVFPRRGIHRLPRLPDSRPGDSGPAPDTEMLYRYLRQYDAISSPHTTASSMGTDWRNYDPEVEPIVEIYQGSRASYERADGPRAPGAAVVAPYKKGFVNEALKKGYRLGFQASSDHRSTHVSYAMVWVDEPGRDAILQAMKARRIYAATDNIIADVREVSGAQEYFMGEDFRLSSIPKLRVDVRGTAPIGRVVIIKDDKIVHDIAPGTQDVLFEWEDPDPSVDETSWYYVRVEQTDGELAWISPMWIHYEPGGKAVPEPEGETAWQGAEAR